MTNSPGPTSAGSINARLTLDADEFEQKMRQAGELADRLDGRDINVHARADIAQAITEMEALNEAEQRVQATDRAGVQTSEAATQATVQRAAATTRHASAAQTEAESLARVEIAERRLQAAQMDLNQVQEDGTATQQRLLRAQNAVENAGLQYDRALEQRRAFVEAGTEAEREATAESDAHTSALERNTDAVNRNTQAEKGQFTWMQALLAAAPALLAATSELAAATVGMGTAFTIMGAAAVAAVKGIKSEMQDGTQAGEEYASGLTVLKGDLDALERTAAVHMLDSFNVAVADINTRMPFLNQIIGEMGTQLGRIGGGLLSDVLMGLDRMQPLIEQGAQSLAEFVGWLGHFTSSDGFSQFVAYAIQTLPQVITFLEDVVTLAGHLIAAFAPLGPAVLGALDGIVAALNALPLPVLAGLTQTALTIGPAFAIARAAVATFGETAALQALNVTVFGTAVNLAVPVVGILVAALAGLGMGIAAAATSQQQAIPTAQAYADALARDGDAVGEYTRQLAAKNLAESGAYTSAQKLGISQEEVTLAVTQGGVAYDTLLGKLRSMQQENAQAAGGHGVAATAVHAHADAIQALIAQVEGNRNAITGEITSLEQEKVASAGSTQAAQQKAVADAQGAAALGTTTQAYQAAAAAQENSAQKTRDATLAMQMQNDAAGLLKAALDNLNGKALSAAQAQNAFDSQLANMGTHVDKVGKQIQFTTNNIGNMSAASVALRGQLNSQVAALQQVVEANGGLDNSTGQAKAQMEQMRQQIIDNAVAHGVDRDAVTAYIDKILQIPASVPPTKIDADTAAAQAKIAAVQYQLDALHDKTVRVLVSTVNTGDGQNAPGTGGGVGLVHANAHGGWAGTGPAYFSAGGAASRYARGTDTIPTMLSPGEFTVNATAASRVGAPALDYINRTGQLPPTQGSMGPVTLVAYVMNPFTGEQVRATVAAVADQRIGAAARDAAALRPGLA